MPEPSTTAIAPPVKHCRSCQCDPDDSDSLTVYAPNERMYGRCDTCNAVKWHTEIYTGHCGSPRRSAHCGCCIHPHDLKPGGHNIPTRGGNHE
jgi:hypothetical protein